MGCAQPAPAPVAPSEADEEARNKLIAELIPPCPTETLKGLVGRPLDTRLEAEVKRLSGFQLLRVRRPGEPYTEDLRSDRLNVDVDGAGRVVRFVCE